MTPSTFSRIGELLFGPSWRAALGLALNIGERKIRRMAGAEASIPDGIDADLATLCRDRAAQLIKAAEQLEEKSHAYRR